jgi:hypothetical protein
MESQRLMKPVFRGHIPGATGGGGVGRRWSSVGVFAASRRRRLRAHRIESLAGWPSDFSGLRRSDARAFVEYYVPGNVVMSVVGA